MKVDELKYVVGEAQEAKPVYMRFYGKIDEESTRNFNDEFLWIQDYVKPSKIVRWKRSVRNGNILHYTAMSH